MSDATEERIARFARWGRVLTGVGILLTVAGAVSLGVSSLTQAVFAADRAEMPDVLEYDASAGTQRIMLLADPLRVRIPYLENPEAYIACVVTHPDGTTTEIDGSRAVSRIETDAGTEIGSFEAQTGLTTVACAFEDGRDTQRYFYSVAPASSLTTTIGIIGLVVGILALAIGGTLLVLAMSARATNLRRIPPGSGPTVVN